MADPVSPLLGDAIARFATRNGLTLTWGQPAPAAVLVTVGRDRGTTAESCHIKCNGDGITLTAADDRGTFYGLGTVEQILAQTGNAIPWFEIRDTPDFATRGVVLDISRCKVPTMETLFDLIEALARLKYNQLQLYTEHTFAFVNHRTVWADASPLTAAEIRKIESWCRERFIDLVPNLNSFGHFERWLRHPAYRQFSECPDGFRHPISGDWIDFGSTLRPNRQSLALLSELYEEYLPLFSHRSVNVGGDEPWELGLGWSKRRCTRVGTTTVYVDFLKKIQKLVTAQDRQMMFWSDIVLREPDSLKSLSREAIALNWGYEGNHPFKRECAQIAAAGLPFHVCPGTSSWNSLTGRIANAEANLANAARAGIDHGACGYQVTDWGDHGHHQYLPFSYPGWVMGACNAWNHRGSRKLDWADGINRLFLASGAGEAASILVDVGRVLELASVRVRNGTLFNRLLFWDMRTEPSGLSDTTAAELDACHMAFAHLRARLQSLDSAVVMVGEIGNAIDLAQHGIERLQLTRGLRTDTSRMRDALAQAIGSHEMLWWKRNRPGGLRESTGHLVRSLQALEMV